MKKKLTAIVALMAMLLTILPSAAFADDPPPPPKDINIYVWNFDSNMAEPNTDVIIALSGSDVVKGSRYSCILKGQNDILRTGILEKNGDNLIYIPKTDIPNLADQYTANELTVTITNASGSEILATQTFWQNVISTAPQKMMATIKDGVGTKNREFYVQFDAAYVPGPNDKIHVIALDADGDKTSDAEITESVTISGLANEVNADGMRNYKKPLRYSFDNTAKSVEISFWRDDKKIDAFTTELSLAPPYGEFKALELVFDRDVIARGETLKGKLYYVNTAGVRTDITDQANYTYGDTANAIGTKKGDRPELSIKSNAALGSKVTVTAVLKTGSVAAAVYDKSTVIKTLTVIDAISPKPVKTSVKRADAGKATTVTFFMLDAAGKETKLSFEPTKVNARWINSTDATANVTFSFGGLTALDDTGVAMASVKSDRPCKGNMEITFSDAKGNCYQVVTDTFTFRDPAAGAEKREVTMNIGVATMSVDGTNVAMDVAPVISNNRTFVPLRALVEAFDADVTWNGADSSIIIKYEDTTVVMYAGKTNYTVNGAAKTMDTAPYIVAGANRTMVPVRFVGEALGFKVTAVAREDGTTASVLFEN